MKKIYWIALAVCVLLFAATPSHAACYYTVNGIYSTCPCPLGVRTSSATVYSPYGYFTVSDELYLPTVTYRTMVNGRPIRRMVVRRPLPPPPPRYSGGHIVINSHGPSHGHSVHQTPPKHPHKGPSGGKKPQKPNRR